MTAEIIIMNAGAIALAADSAATVATGLGEAKVFSSDKIFPLTESAPVGIMTFGNADFMGIPFETIVTEYRRKHGDRTYAHLKDYGEAFLVFLTEEIGLHLRNEQQDNFVLRLVHGIAAEFAALIERELSDLRVELADEDEGTAREIWETEGPRRISVTIEEYRRRIGQAEHVEAMAGEALRAAEQLLESHVDEMLGDVGELELTVGETEQFLQIVRDALPVMNEDVLQFGGDYIGIVVAGFGEENLFPSYYEYHVEGLYRDVLKGREIHHYEIEDSEDSYISPFAQGDVINTFLFGMESSRINQLYVSAVETLEGFAEELISNLKRYSEEERESILSRLADSIEMTSDSFVEDTIDRAAERHLIEIREVASFMPREQLAEMAEALVSLTSLRRRVSFDDESVGGPTDVAVITKGDGLVWIKRKQYFEPGLNPEYLARMSRKG